MSRERLEAAREIAATAGEEALRAFSGGGGAARRKTGPHDLVTEADEQIERQITGLLGQRFPEDGLLGEEGTR